MGAVYPVRPLAIQPRGSGSLDTLRLKWFQRLLDTKDCLKIIAKLQNGVSEPPLDELSSPSTIFVGFAHNSGLTDQDTDILHLVPGSAVQAQPVEKIGFPCGRTLI